MARTSFTTRARAAFMAALVAIASPFRRARGDRQVGGWRFSSASMSRPKALPAGAPTGQQAREFPFENIVEHPEYAATIPVVVSIYREAEAGNPRRQCDLFDGLVEGDCTLRNLFDQRRQAVAGKPYVVQAGGGADMDKQAARALAAALARLPMVDLFEHQLGFNVYGWGASEIDWGPFEFEGRTWVVPQHFAHVPPRRFNIDVTTNTLRLRTLGKPQGEPLEPGKWIVTTRPGRLASAALTRSAAFPAVYKRLGKRDWMVFLQKFGLPLVLVKYDAAAAGDREDADDASRIVAEDVARNIGSDGSAVVSRGIEVEIKDTIASGDSTKTHGGLVADCNAEMAKLINGATLSNDNAGSAGASYALGAVHDNVRWDNVVYDTARLQESFRTQIATPFLAFNGLAGGAAPLLKIQIVKDAKPIDRLKAAEAYVNLGGKVSRTQLAEDGGFRDPLDEDDELSAATMPAAAPPAAPPAPAAKLGRVA